MTPNQNSDGLIGLSQKEIARFSIARAIQSSCPQLRGESGFGEPGFEAEVSTLAQKKYGRASAGFTIPLDVTHQHQRTYPDSTSVLNTGTSTLGGSTVQTDVRGQSFIDLLRAKTVLSKLCSWISGLTGKVQIPRETGPTTATWATEVAQNSPSVMTLDQITLSQHRISATCAFSRELFRQSSVDVEGLVRNDLALVNALAIDLAAIAGTGTNGQPAGIYGKVPAGNQITFSNKAGVTYPVLLSFRELIELGNADLSEIVYVSSPATKQMLSVLPRVGSTFPSFVVEQGRLDGHRFLVTNQIPAGGTGGSGGVPVGDCVICGAFETGVIIADWAGLDVIVNPFSLAQQGLIEVTTNMFVDVGVRHPEALSCSTDKATYTS